MAYNKTVFDKLISLEVPFKIALALSDDNSPVKVIVPQTAPAALAGGETLPNTVAAFNTLRTKLIDAGVFTA